MTEEILTDFDSPLTHIKLNEYFELRKNEIQTARIINNLTDFCIYLINEIAKSDINKAKELQDKMIEAVIYHRSSEVKDDRNGIIRKI